MSDAQQTAQPSVANQDTSDPAESGVGGLIVVGVDGSPGGSEALRFALVEAQLRGAELQAVAAWRYPDSYGERLALPTDDELAAAAHDALVETISAVGDPADVEVTPVVREGRAALVLLEAAADANLLVVGSRGRGGFTGLLLGSVSQKCIQHAPCPVVVVPPRPSSDDNNPGTVERGH